MDETLSQRQNLRRHTRYDCLVGVEYRIDDARYQCYMRDLSEGGAYIETEQPVEMGQELVLTLYSPMLERSCDIDGKVVRKDTGGIGVRFQPIIPEQKQVINSLIESCCSPITSSSRHA
jgi:Tfp pilus assembly protein PilZ